MKHRTSAQNVLFLVEQGVIDLRINLRKREIYAKLFKHTTLTAHLVLY